MIFTHTIKSTTQKKKGCYPMKKIAVVLLVVLLLGISVGSIFIENKGAFPTASPTTSPSSTSSSSLSIVDESSNEEADRYWKKYIETGERTLINDMIYLKYQVSKPLSLSGFAYQELNRLFYEVEKEPSLWHEESWQSEYASALLVFQESSLILQNIQGDSEYQEVQVAQTELSDIGELLFQAHVYLLSGYENKDVKALNEGFSLLDRVRQEIVEVEHTMDEYITESE